MSKETDSKRYNYKRNSYTRKNNGELTSSLLESSKHNYVEISSMNKIEAKDNHDNMQSKASHIQDYGYDLVIVVDNPKVQTQTSRNHSSDYHLNFDEILERLSLANFDLQLFYSNDENQSKIYIKIHASLDVLMKHADIKNYPLRVNENYARLHIDNPHALIPHDSAISLLSPYEYIYVNYSVDKKDMFENAKGYRHPFSDVIRVKLILSIISSSESGCCSMNLDKLVTNKYVISYYPLHNHDSQTLLAKHWFPWSIPPWHQPTDEIKDYFGEKIGIYYEFFGHYSTWLVPLGIAGLVVCLDLIIESGIDHNANEALMSAYLIPFYCIFVSIWAQMMLEYWKRKEVTKAMEWGQTEFEETEYDRPQFRGDYRQSIIDGSKIKYFPPADRMKRMIYSYFIISLMILLVIACVSLIFLAQYYVNDKVEDDQVKSDGSTVTSIVSAIQIVVLKMLYGQIAEHLTDHENHRTATEYEDSLIVKLFAFNFVNSYASLLFVAFIKTNMETCLGSCMGELSYQLTIIFVVALVVDKAQKFAYMYAKKVYNKRELEKAKQAAIDRHEDMYEPSPVEKEFLLDDYNASLDTLSNYSEVAIQYGFVTLFVGACPIAPTLAYISNLIEIRSDGYNMLYNSKRVVPCGGEDIGTWMTIFQIISVICVITNAGLICFTMDLITFDGVGKVWIFIVFQYVIIATMGVFSMVIPDMPEQVSIQLERQKHLNTLADLSEEDKQAMINIHHMDDSNQKHAVRADTIPIHTHDVL